jgi:DNA-binding PucR family transcriptional regulator
MRQGALPHEDGPFHCVDQVAALVTSVSEDLVGVAMRARLAPFFALPARRRKLLAQTLLAYMRCGDNAVTAAKALHIHEQTVRYRIRKVEEMFGKTLYEPEARLDVMLMLQWWLR